MATQAYRVCDGALLEFITITTAFTGVEQTRTYNEGTCTVTEKTKNLRISASQAVDTAYNIWYQVTVIETKTGNPNPSTTTLTYIIEMEANRTYIDVEVFTEIERDCASADDFQTGDYIPTWE